MTAHYWLKLWLDMMDDPKVARWPDWLFRRWIMFLLAAKEYDKGGYLQPEEDLAYRLRLDIRQVEEALQAFSQAGVVRKDAQGWLIVNFAKRQGATPGAERTARSRKRANVTSRYTEERQSRGRNKGETEAEQSAPAVAQPQTAEVFKVYSREIGVLTSTVSDAIGDAIDEYSAEWVTAAIRESAMNNARNWRYTEAILKRWKAEGFNSKKAPQNNRNGKNGKPAAYVPPAPPVPYAPNDFLDGLVEAK